MKEIIFSIIFVLSNLASLAQKRDVAFQNLNPVTENDFYWGVENKYRVLVEGHFCNEYSISCDSCEFRQNGCYVYITSIKSAQQFYKIRVGYDKIIDTITLTAGAIDTPNILIDDWVHHQLNYLKVYEPAFDTKCQVDSFIVEVIQSDKLIYSRRIYGSLFPDDIRKLYLDFKIGDILRIRDLYLTVNNRLKFKIDQRDFKIEY